MKKFYIIMLFAYYTQHVNAQSWNITGNAGTDSSINFIGTTDAHPLVFKVNKQKAGWIDYNASMANTGYGYQSLFKNKTGVQNTATGLAAMYSNTSGNYNAAYGYHALYSNTKGNANTAIGIAALYINTIGHDNTANGNVALYNNKTGINNTAIGDQSLYSNTTGSNNTALGFQAGVSIVNLNNATAIGSNASVACSNCMVLGSVNGVNGGTANTKIGVGITNPTRAIIEQNGSVGNTAAIFGGDGAGISLQKDWPAIGFNHYYDGSSHRSIGAGFSAQLGVNQSTGSLYLATWNQNAATGANFFLNPTAATTRFFISKSGNVGIGRDNPQSDLDITMSGILGGDNSYDHVKNGLRLINPFDNSFWNIGFFEPIQPFLYLFFQGSPKGFFAIGDGSYTTVSDKNLKTEINYLPNGILGKVLALKPATYFMVDDKIRDAKSYGFIAQDVEKIFPEIVKKIDDKTKGLTYQYFIPVLTKAIQELAEQNDSLQKQTTIENEKINDLQDVNSQLKSRLDKIETIIQQIQQCSPCGSLSSQINSPASSTAKASLEQNTPNPFNNSTVIKYYLPAQTNNAQILISDINGHVLKSISIKNKGAGQILLSAGALSAGSYFYSLLIDGKKIDTKQMILTK